jgi:YD repeat-containing protein
MERINYSFAKQVGFCLVCLVNLHVPPFLNAGNLFAQSDEMYQPASFPPSPEVSALAKFADIPISRYNGLPNTTIPLYEVTYEDFSLPISLSYHHGGIRVEERAGWVGLGWALQAGGSISRTIKGIPDEARGASTGFLNHNLDYEKLTSRQQADFYLKTAEGLLDSEQDLFFYSFGPYSGKFVLNKDRSVFFLQGSSLKVEFAISNNRISSWRVWDEWGNQYHFNESERSLQENISGARVNRIMPISNSAWHLSEVTTYRGRKIRFTYTSYSEETYRRTSQTASYNELGPSFKNACSSERSRTQWVRTTIFGKQISKIDFAEGEVHFIGSADRQDSPTLRLTGVQVINKQGRLIKDFRLEQRYFLSNLHGQHMQLPALVNANTPNRRLRLDKLTERKAGEVYGFEYDGGSLPHLFSLAQDHWGFYNGQANPSLIPKYLKYSFGNANRLCNPSFASMGHLKKIHFPTGGSVAFEMEGNTAMVTRAQYAQFLAPLHQHGAEETYHVRINENQRNTTLTVEPQLFDYDTIKPFEVLVNVGDLESFNGTDRDKVGTLDINLFNQQTGHFISLTTGRFQQGQLRGQVFLRAGHTYTLRMNGRQSDMRGVGAMVKGFKNPAPLGNPGEQIEIPVGGLRVKRVVKDFVPKKETINYEYSLASGGSSGVLSFFPLYDVHRFNLTVDALPLDMGKIISGCVLLELVSHSNIPLGSSGSYFGYSRVRELIGTGDQQIRSDYHYFSALDHPDIVQYAYPAGLVQSNEYRRGLPKSEVNWARVGQQFRKARELRFTYANHQPGGDRNYQLGCGSFGPGGCLKILPLKYVHHTTWAPEIRREERLFDLEDGSFLQKSTDTEYNQEYLLPTRMIQNSSEGEDLVDTYFYPFNLPSSQYATGEQEAIQQLIRHHRIGIPLMTRVSKGGVLREESRVVVANEKGLVVPKRWEWGRGGPGRVEKTSYLSYDDFLNVTEEKARNGPPVYYGYETHGRYLNLVALNATQSQVAYTSFETEDKGGWDFTGNRMSSTNSKTGRFCYNLSGGPISKSNIPATSTQKYRVSFYARRLNGTGTWNFLGKSETLTTEWRLIERELSSSALELRGANILVDELRLFPEDAFLHTYTYEPLVGMLTHTNERGYTIYFEYDEAGRLIATRNDEGYLMEHFEYRYAQLP